LNSRPLPYQGSALPLSYASLKPTLQSYRERSLPNTTRKAKNASRIRHRSRYLPGSIVLQALADSSPRTTREITIRPLPAGLKSTLHQPCKSSQPTPYYQTTSTRKKCGAQGRIRTSVTQRVADLQSAAINHSATCAHPEIAPTHSTLPSPFKPHSRLTQSSPRIQAAGSKFLRSGGVPRARTTRRYNQIQTPKTYRNFPYYYTLPKDRIELELTKGFEPPTL
jgi:hypothetical protein